MGYTAPTTRSTGELITASIFNTDIVDNIAALFSPPSDDYTLNEGSDYTTTSTSFTDIDATNLSLSITPVGTEIEVHFHGSFQSSSSSSWMALELDINGVAHAGDNGIISGRFFGTGTGVLPVSFTRRITVSAGVALTIKLQWRTNTGTLTLHAGAGTSNGDLHPQFWVIER